MLEIAKSTGETRAPKAAQLPSNGQDRPEYVFGMPAAASRWVGFMEITPERAERLLAFNVANRLEDELTRDEYAHLIQSGQFEETHQGIAFDRNGVMLDGQTRLAAVVKAGMSVDMQVTFGLKPGIFGAVDRGRRRQLSHYYTARGVARGAQATYLGAATRILFHFDAGRFPWDKKPAFSPRDSDDTQARHPHLAQAVAEATSHVGLLRLPPGAAAAFLALFMEVDLVEAQWFLDRLRTGADLEAGHPILVLRNSVLSASGKLNTSEGRNGFMCRLVRAWNNVRDGNLHVKSLSGAPREGRFPEVSGYSRGHATLV